MNRLLEIENLKVHFPLKAGLLGRVRDHVYAVDGVDLIVNKGETLGIVGESGCGKSTLGLAVMKLINKTSGKIFFDGDDTDELIKTDKKSFNKNVQMVFQDPYSSLNPRIKIKQAIAEPMKLHGVCSEKELEGRVGYLLEKVGLSPAAGNRYPHEFSGGQRQRICIARALSLNPRLIIGDEPVSALDVSVQAQVINLLMDLQKEFQLSYIIISHDLAVVEHICDRIAVMYLGKIVETGTWQQIYQNPQHPYTQALLSAVPNADKKNVQDRIILEGNVPSPINPPSGCYFHTRCPKVMEKCKVEMPDLTPYNDQHMVRCLLHEK